jgi:FAD/FMN-containing dehydrogenase
MVQLDTTTFKTNFSGKIILPGDEAYETARTTYAVKDAKPAIIVRATSNQDITAAIDFAKTNHLEISVRSGGHSIAGFSTNNGGLVLDLSRMNTIEVLDKETGLVRLESGALWGDVAVKLATYGLALSSGDTKTVAVGGLTLGGGIGWMVRKYGYAIDSLVAADVVLADGSVVRADKSEHSDLFWAIRGGGGNVGVVSSFEFKAHPGGKIVESTLMYGIDNVQKTLTGWRNCLRSAPEDLTSFMTLLPGFGGSAPQIMIMSCYAGDDIEQANAAIAPLRQLGNMTSDDTSLKDYADILQEAHPPGGIKFVAKNMFAETLSDKLVADLSHLCCKSGSPIVHLRMMNGAISKVDPGATAIPHRRSEVFFFAGFPMPPDATEEQELQYLKPWEKLARYRSGAYGNFLSTHTKEDVAQIYPQDTYQRLAKIKRIYDPENIFRHTFNVTPADE